METHVQEYKENVQAGLKMMSSQHIEVNNRNLRYIYRTLLKNKVRVKGTYKNYIPEDDVTLTVIVFEGTYVARLYSGGNTA